MANAHKIMAKPVVEVVRIGRRGELLLPARVRNSLTLQEGDELVLSVVDTRIVLERRVRHFSAYLDAMNSAAGPKRDE